MLGWLNHERDDLPLTYQRSVPTPPRARHRAPGPWRAWGRRLALTVTVPFVVAVWISWLYERPRRDTPRPDLPERLPSRRLGVIVPYTE